MTPTPDPLTPDAPKTERDRIRNLIDQFAAGLHTADEMPGLILATLDAERSGPAPEAERSPLVCCLCLFVGPSDDPDPVTVINGALVCEPHNGHFQGGDHARAIIAWKREHPEARP